MVKQLLLFILLALLPGFGQTPKSAQAPEVTKDDAAPLELAISQVKSALDLYQNNLGAGKDALPPLDTVEFNFKTTTAKTDGFTLNLFIFKFGTSHEKDAVNDVTYTYSMKRPKPLGSANKPPELKDELAQTIQSAAKAVKTSTALGNIPFSKLTVTLEYGIKWDVAAGGSYQFTLVTLGVSRDKSKNTVQSVKLIFGQ